MMTKEQGKEHGVQTVSVFNGSRKDVFESLDLLHTYMGNPVLDKGLVERDGSTILTRHDIHNGDIIPYIDANGDFACVGFNLEPKDMNRIVYLYGELIDLVDAQEVEVSFVELRDGDNRQAFKHMLFDLENLRKNAEDHFSHVTLVHASKDELFGFIDQINEHSENDNPAMPVLSVSDFGGDMFDIRSVDQLDTGMMVAGQRAEDDNDIPELVFIGHDVDVKDLESFVRHSVESLGLGSFGSMVVTVQEETFKDYVSDMTVKQYT